MNLWPIGFVKRKNLLLKSWRTSLFKSPRCRIFGAKILLRSDCGGSPHFANKPFILCALIMLALGWVVLLSGIEGHAAEAPSAIPGTASPTISPSEKTTAEIESLVRQLEDPSERAALIGRLRLLLQSRKEGLAGKGSSSPQTAHSYARAIQKVNQTITAGLKSLYTVLPTLRLFFGKLQGFSAPEAFFSLLRLSIAVAFSLFLMYLVRRFFHKFLPAETVDPPLRWEGKDSQCRSQVDRPVPSLGRLTRCGLPHRCALRAASDGRGNSSHTSLGHILSAIPGRVHHRGAGSRTPAMAHFPPF